VDHAARLGRARHTPQPLFDCSQVGRLPHKSRSMQSSQRWKEMCMVVTKVGKESGILAQTPVRSRNFYGEHLTIAELRDRAALTQLLSLGDHRHYLVNPAKTCENKVVQVHDVPPQKRFVDCSEDMRMSLFFGKETSTSRYLTPFS
jgi:hypothetical protein